MGGEKATPIYLQGRKVASVKDGVLHRTLSGAKHFLRGEAICFVVEVLQRAKALGAKSCEVRDRDDGSIYTCPLSAFWELGFELTNAFGKQRGLNLIHFEKKAGKVSPIGDSPQSEPSKPIVTETLQLEQQLTMFEPKEKSSLRGLPFEDGDF